MTDGDPKSQLVRIQLGARLREARAARCMTQLQVANITGIAKTYISSIEHGKQNITIENVVRIAEALDHDIIITLRPRSPIV